ncbi:MAG TPA: hypothetical protein VFD48_00675 [Pyrinomonadaceae bacterium]|nr:hypothetical protein [Pyrinomonadaceae bacterium]
MSTYQHKSIRVFVVSTALSIAFGSLGTSLQRLSAQSRASGWFYNFGRGGQALHRQSGGEKQTALSVRCVRD